MGSPVTLLVGHPSDENLVKAAMITARYSAAKGMPSVRVAAQSGDSAEQEFEVTPIRDEELRTMAIL